MGFDITNNVSGNKFSLQQLTAGLDEIKDKKKIDRITQIFNKYNTNNDGKSANLLDIDEQVSIMNDYHKADRNNDNNISRRSLRKSGIEGEYKAYKDFMEAYQKAVGETSVNSYNLEFKDGTVEGEAFTQTTATQQGETLTVTHEYLQTENSQQKVKTTYSGEEGTLSYSPKGQLLQQTVGDITLKYRQYDSDARNATPGIITISSDNQQQRLELQQDGTYLNKADNSHYRLNNNKLLDEFAVDEKNRVTSEFWGEDTFDYTYNGDAKEPATITVNANSDNQKVYTQEKGLYTSQNGENKEYFNFDQEKRVFTQTEAPKPKIVKQTRPTERHLIKMTAGWKNQKVKPDADTTAKFNSMSKAEEILTELINLNDNFKDTNINKENLLSDLIKNNPSVFNKEGIIYSDAKWDKLDFPKDLSKYQV